MKERLILFCMLLLCGIGVSRAQSDNAKDFDQKKKPSHKSCNKPSMRKTIKKPKRTVRL